MLRHLPLVRSVASQFRVPAADVDDLCSAGTIGLIEAADRYDGGRGVPFGAFAYQRIRGAIIDELRRACAPGRTLVREHDPYPVALDAPLTRSDEATLLDVTANPRSPDPSTCAELEELLAAIEALPAREREMLALNTAGHTVREIAEIYGCTSARASQLLSRARDRLEWPDPP